MPETKGPGEYDRHIGVDNSNFDYALELTLRDPNRDDGSRVDRVVRVPVEDIPEFLTAVVRHCAYALADAATNLEAGHCETCGNTSLIHVEKNGRPWSERCPDCTRTQIQPFKNAPHVGRRNS